MSMSWRPRHVLALCLFPAALLLVLFLAIPLCGTVWLSLTPNSLLHFHAPGFGNYHYMIGKKYYEAVMIRTLRLASEATLASLLIGYPAALALQAAPARLANILGLAMVLPVLSGPLVVVLGWMTLLSDGGPLLHTLSPLGIGRLHLLGSETGIVIGMVHFTLPFVVLSLAAVLRAIPANLVEAAQSLGAGRIGTFLHVTWPLSLPGVISALMIAFSIATSAYVAPHYLGGAADITLATLVAQFVLGTYNGAMAATAAVVLLVIMTALILAFTVVTARWLRR